MNESNPLRRSVVGIDVGGAGKGFHAVILRDGRFESKRFNKDTHAAAETAAWCRDHDAQVIAIDAPCRWATSNRSRLVERSLMVGDVTLQCFKTPTRATATGNPFYGWVFNGEALYQALFPDYQLFDGSNKHGKIVLETFPHLIACSLAGRVIPARPKVSTRRRLLRDSGYDDATLKNIDFVDAALCALTAERFLQGRTRSIGDLEEGFIVVPSRTGIE